MMKLSINNEIKSENEILSSLFKIKKNEHHQNNNNNIDMNQMKQTMSQQQMRQKQMMQQQMRQQQMMQQQMKQQQMMRQQMIQQQMIQQQMMQQQMMQQQMMQQQMMQQQMMQQQAKQAEIESSQGKEICVIFRRSSLTGQASSPVYIQCMPDEKISKVIEKYRNQSGDYVLTKKFIFNGMGLNMNLSVAEAGINNHSNIFVVSSK